MLSQINNHEPDKEYIIQSFKEKFTSEAVEKRLNEQIKINNIKLLKNENNSMKNISLLQRLNIHKYFSTYK